MERDLRPWAKLGAVAAFVVAGSLSAQQTAQHLADQTASTPRSSLPQAPSAVLRPLNLSGVMVAREQAGAIPLTLDQAIATALRSNTELQVRQQQEKFVRGQLFAVGSALTPQIEAKAYTRAQEVNLAAMGFKPGGAKIPGFTGRIPTIVKVNTTSAQLTLSQQLFNVPAYYLFRAAQKAGEAATWATLSARGGVVLGVGGLYLQALADTAQVRNAEALVRQDQLVFEHAKAAKEAGVGINLDVLRAQVELQSQQQQVIRLENAIAKDKIQLNRVMGQPAGQELELVDAVPFAEFDVMPLGEALKLAYERRKDLRGLQAQLEVAQKAKQAVRYERVPTLGVGGFYGVLGETTGLYHGVFAAEGRLSVPVFQEAALRGQREVAEAQITGLQRQIESRRGSIEADIRGSMLDVDSSRALVKVARSNVELAGQALGDATERFTAGVDDNLPVVRAQATLAGAQTRLVQAEFQYNYAKLTLARNTGVVETEYKRYLGR